MPGTQKLAAFSQVAIGPGEEQPLVARAFAHRLDVARQFSSQAGGDQYRLRLQAELEDAVVLVVCTVRHGDARIGHAAARGLGQINEQRGVVLGH